MRCAIPSLGSRLTNSLRSRIAKDRMRGQSGVGRGASNMASTSIAERSIRVPTMRLLAKSFESSGSPLRIARRQRSITRSKSSRLWADSFCSIAASKSACPSLALRVLLSVSTASNSPAMQRRSMSGERPAEQQEKNIVNQINIMWQRGVCIQIFLENRVLNLRSGINENQ